MIRSKAILSFLALLSSPSKLPSFITTLHPYKSKEGWRCAQLFYNKYYQDYNGRHILFGINPGRWGGGITGVPFTDPVQLQNTCNIDNSLKKKTELSSRFIYDVIDAYGGDYSFYSQFYITGISPLGYTQNGKNTNYYDISDWKNIFEKDVIQWITVQLEFGIKQDKAYSIGKGKNMDFLTYINKKYHFFDEIIALPHPRWVMQYNTKNKQQYIQEYLVRLGL